MDYINRKIRDYDVRVVLRDNWTKIKQLIKLIVKVGLPVAIGFLGVSSDSQIVNLAVTVVSVVLIDFIHYLIKPETNDETRGEV